MTHPKTGSSGHTHDTSDAAHAFDGARRGDEPDLPELGRALRTLADRTEAPRTPVTDDVRRGRRSLLRRRAATGLGATVAAAAVAGAVVVGSSSLQPKPSAPMASAPALTLAPAGNGSGVTGTAPATPEPSVSDPPEPTAYDQDAVVAAVVRHLDPTNTHYPDKTRDVGKSWGNGPGGDLVVQSVTVPWEKSTHTATVGVRVSVWKSQGPECTKGAEAHPNPTCSTVRLGGVAVTKVSFSASDGAAPDYWRKNAKGAWVSVQVFRVSDAFLTNPSAPATVDTTPLPEMGIDESHIGPLLADPALDVTLQGS